MVGIIEKLEKGSFHFGEGDCLVGQEVDYGLDNPAAKKKVFRKGLFRLRNAVRSSSGSLLMKGFLFSATAKVRELKTQ